MQLTRTYLGTFFIVALAIACKPEKKVENTPSQLPNTPKEVTLRWQSLMDSNQFTLARQLSTEGVKQLIASLEMQGQIDSLDILMTKFISIDCAENGDSATCNCMLEATGQQYKDHYALVRINGQWLVDVSGSDEEGGGPADIPQDEYEQDIDADSTNL